MPKTKMTLLARATTPTSNKRLNELVGLLIFLSSILLALSLVSYHPGDPSLNTSSSAQGGREVANWIGMAGAFVADLALQTIGIAVFLVPVFMVMFAVRWFRSRTIASPVSKLSGVLSMVVFSSAFLGLLPWHWHWARGAGIEGLMGRIVADAMIHYLNLVGAYIVCIAAIVTATYLSTAFSVAELHIWSQTRFAFAYAWWDRFQDWKKERENKKAADALAKKREQKPVVTAQLVPAKGRLDEMPQPVARVAPPQAAVMARPAVPVAAGGSKPKSGIEKMLEEDGVVEEPKSAKKPIAASVTPAIPAEDMDDDDAETIAVGPRADALQKPKTTMPKIAGTFKLPSSALLRRPDEQQQIDEEELKELAQVLVEKCAEFGVHGQITQINPGPVVTTFEFKPEAGIKYSRITGLAEDLCLAMKAESILIERMAGKSTVGIQVPNHQRETIFLREVVESNEFIGGKSKTTLALGKDINGRIVCAELNGMPHLLIAGSTGSGKSVAINAFIMSVLYKSTPEQVRLILVDPKRLELGNYEGVPHLYTPIITEPKLASNALKNAVREMERRLKVLAEKGVRNIDQYNKLFEGNATPSLFEDGETEHKPLPYIVIIIDELADLMMLDGANVEESITRLAQMARAVGIHLVLATQRPSVDVITGLIKANFPSRMSFRVATKIDSRTILDGNGAEQLLGRGDMLYLPSGSARVQRVHAPFVTEKEIEAVVEFWKAQGTAQYEQKFLQAPKEEGNSVMGEGGAGGDGELEGDPMYQDAVKLVLEFGKASTSLLQRRLRVGYGRAAHLIDLMEQDGIVGAADGPKPREVLKRPDWLNEVEESLR
ncbi:DNA translocase FtsK [Candidatus Koribacter versatilis Ellin345]|uniref:DNA translocase FtsK n=2 Tax=Candidatus Korobacter versatilis TaxID=658062 RepID=Q1IQU2_KORVE|nr:DNA translocase FtsK [Candidatus Koribacter versatilis Ellin345]